MNGGTPGWSPEELRVVALAHFYALLVVVGILATCALAGHACARMRFRWRSPFLWAALALLLMPDLMILPSLLVSSSPGGGQAETLQGQLAWRIVGSHHMRLHLALGVLLLRQCFRHVPVEYEEAALLEGAGPWQGFCRAALPMTTLAITLLAMFVSRAVFDAVHEFLSPHSAFRAIDFAPGSMIDFFTTARDWRNGDVVVIIVGIAPLPVLCFFGLRRLSQGRAVGGIRG